MKPVAVLYALGSLVSAFTVPALICSVWAFFNDRYEQASLFIVTAALCIVGALLLLVATRKDKDDSGGLENTLSYFISAWIILSLVGAIPFLRLTDGNFIAALFESVSCLTTTGSSIVASDKILPASVVGWRGILHLAGAVLAISGAVLLFANLNRTGPSVHRSRFFEAPAAQSFALIPRVFVQVGSLVGGLAAVAFISLLMLGASPRDAYALSISAATTGLVSPFPDSLGHNEWVLVILALTLVFATLNLGVLAGLTRWKLKRTLDRETIAIMLLIAIVAMTLVLHHGPGDATRSPAGLLFASVSIISTSGMGQDLDRIALSLPLAAIIFFIFIGGGAVSSAGGVKVGRFLVLIARVGHEFARLAQPSAVLQFRYRGERISPLSVVSVWIFLTGFAVTLLASAIVLSASGLDFVSSISLSISALCNAAILYDPMLVSGSYVPSFVTLWLTAMMLVGRLEVILLLGLLARRS